MANRVQTIRYYTTLERPPVTEFAGELYINYADIQIGALDTSKSPIDFVAIRYYSQLALYVAGDFAVYNGDLYRCLQNDTQGAFDSTRWSKFIDLQEINVLIAVETNRAEAAEQHLQDEIDKEIADRIAGDQTLQNQINGLTTALGALLPPGISLEYYGANAPTGWLLENGATYPVNTYPALGGLLGGTPGGSFTVPNSMNRFGVGAGNLYPLLSTGGSATATIAVGNLPSHSHTIPSHTHPGSTDNHTHATYDNASGLLAGVGSGLGVPVGVGTADQGPPYKLLNSVSTGPALGTVTIVGSGVLTSDPVGSGAPVTTLPPYISRTRIIKI